MATWPDFTPKSTFYLQMNDLIHLPAIWHLNIKNNFPLLKVYIIFSQHKQVSNYAFYRDKVTNLSVTIWLSCLTNFDLNLIQWIILMSQTENFIFLAMKKLFLFFIWIFYMFVSVCFTESGFRNIWGSFHRETFEIYFCLSEPAHFLAYCSYFNWVWIVNLVIWYEIRFEFQWRFVSKNRGNFGLWRCFGLRLERYAGVCLSVAQGTKFWHQSAARY